MEFKKYEQTDNNNKNGLFKDISVIGFGCPPILSKELLQPTQAYITTVVADFDVVPRLSADDVVPRLSAASITNVVLDAMSFDYRDRLEYDIGFMASVLREKFPFLSTVLDGLESMLLKFVAQSPIPKATTNNAGATTTLDNKNKQRPILLFPPGRCLHFQRDAYHTGQTRATHFSSCEHFDAIDLHESMLTDHFVPTGYHRLFSEYARQQMNHFDFTFLRDGFIMPTAAMLSKQLEI
eukprot:CAMPEP_0118706840 /NCGR_PEP_ID=MMETSP0800-20121206/20818_1 /TAXON_ID=210618 ORGANISM="Striatella unipunctata, Strain CCMP2910" /NCGR_SAMPLE_ID=MMETSP0800 /ASSEMBLY_ACC=CAM_ASM_000638 /LENGTH=237 /DNA_ID=CAMNT_0006609493 /DNA_START=59 /DNA_END=773 /DNA_ORIENTATION=-